MTELENQHRRDYFAGLALQALVSKLPLFDKIGEFGQIITNEQEKELKKGIAISAWIYADWMLTTESESKK